MNRYDRGYRRGGFQGGSWSDPYGGMTGVPYDRQSGQRPGVGGYRDGYQGGSGGMRTGGRGGYGGDYQGDSGATRMGGRPGRTGDEWWLGGHHPGRYDEEYDRAYQEFDRQNRPRFSPVGGTYAAMGGQYQYRRAPRPLREDTWFSDWTRWF